MSVFRGVRAIVEFCFVWSGLLHKGLSRAVQRCPAYLVDNGVKTGFHTAALVRAPSCASGVCMPFHHCVVFLSCSDSLRADGGFPRDANRALNLQ